MPHRPFLSRVQKLFASIADPLFISIEDGFRSGRLRPPVQSMDQELARAIREFQGSPISDSALRSLANQFEKK